LRPLDGRAQHEAALIRGEIIARVHRAAIVPNDQIADGSAVIVGNTRGRVHLHAKVFDGVRHGVLIAESIWPNDAYPDGRGINTITGADPIAPFGGAAFHDNKVWIRPAVAA
jgi:anaerobic selenocysteine-containing dehydrogenase